MTRARRPSRWPASASRSNRPSSTNEPTSGSISKRAPGLDVLQHRRLVLARPSAAPSMRCSIEIRSRRPSFSAISAASCIICAASARVGGSRQISTRVRAGEGADRVQRQVAPRLHPQVRPDVGQHPRREPGRADSASAIAVDPLRSLAVELADREAVTLDEPDDAGRVPLGRRIGDATRRSGRSGCDARACRRGRASRRRRPSNGPGNFWKNHHGTPFWTGTTTVPSWYSRVEPIGDLGDLVRLQRQHHDVLRAELGEVVGRRRRSVRRTWTRRARPA